MVLHSSDLGGGATRSYWSRHAGGMHPGRRTGRLPARAPGEPTSASARWSSGACGVGAWWGTQAAPRRDLEVWLEAGPGVLAPVPQSSVPCLCCCIPLSSYLLQADAEDLPFATDSFDRYVSAGSIEYWPEPQRGIKEAYRVIKEGGTACVIGPVHPTFWLSRFFADVSWTWNGRGQGNGVLVRAV